MRKTLTLLLMCISLFLLPSFILAESCSSSGTKQYKPNGSCATVERVCCPSKEWSEWNEDCKCPGNQILVNNVCQCPEGTIWDGALCNQNLWTFKEIDLPAVYSDCATYPNFAPPGADSRVVMPSFCEGGILKKLPPSAFTASSNTPCSSMSASNCSGYYARGIINEPNGTYYSEPSYGASCEGGNLIRPLSCDSLPLSPDSLKKLCHAANTENKIICVRNSQPSYCAQVHHEKCTTEGVRYCYARYQVGYNIKLIPRISGQAKAIVCTKN